MLNSLVKSDLGQLLEVSTLLDIVHTSFKIGRHNRTSDVLKRTSDMFLLEMVAAVMKRWGFLLINFGCCLPLCMLVCAVVCSCAPPSSSSFSSPPPLCPTLAGLTLFQAMASPSRWSTNHCALRWPLRTGTGLARVPFLSLFSVSMLCTHIALRLSLSLFYVCVCVLFACVRQRTRLRGQHPGLCGWSVRDGA